MSKLNNYNTSQIAIDRKAKKKLLNSSGSDNPFYGKTEKSYLEDKVKEMTVLISDPLFQERMRDPSIDVHTKARELGINISKHR